jgi:hypothetical protein
MLRHFPSAVNECVGGVFPRCNVACAASGVAELLARFPVPKDKFRAIISLDA